ncbi:dihydroorotate dehydrogenase B (NAD(+)), catalytic subunit [Actinomadura sp. NBRC 104425]|uniref:dihydroorotate dehydrogenase n=1 Tax=Actinomadura sp. NBRC 104425 TaxID=3032204 RepID=UPI0024A42AB4|nr:dihydroorotate dehydrogenase [Actinomadura sp. NBRC 104425]GLZ10530.1 dihydroorotate dehydrogenase B (NAD(+)), catalytic subunit [Actinomadura sp. NBRC 104425]
MTSDRMRTRLGDLELPNPVLTASGCGGTGRELAQFTDLTRLGAFVTTSVMAQPRAGRPTPRMAETPSGLLTAMGLPGPGIDGFLERDLPWLAEHGVRTIVSLAGNSVEEFGELARRLRGVPGVAAIEVNVACPNVEDRGRMFAWHPRASAAVVRAVRANSRVPVIAKLAPDVTDIVTIALACVDAGADALTLINTMVGMAIDTDTLRPTLAGVSGGLSGPAVRPVAVRCVYQVHAALPGTPIIGAGGVATGLDALEFVLAGASAVAVGTTLFHDPSAGTRILRELEDALAARRLTMADAVGLAHKPPGYVPPQVRPEEPVPAETKEKLP